MSDMSALLSLINERNNPGRLLTSKNVVITDPVPATRQGSDVNTKVTVTGRPGHGYYGSVDIYYKRLDLDAIIPQAHARSTKPLTRQQVIDAVNNVYGLKLRLEDVDNFTVPEYDPDHSATVTLQASVDSLLVTGDFDLVLEYGKPTLIEVSRSKNLQTFRHPTDQPNWLNARMLTWFRDFSSIQTALRRTYKESSYSDWDTVRTACGSLGIPGWTKGTVLDLPTSQVPDANPAFQQVVIQRNVSGGGLKGDLYFHFNPF